MLSGLKLATLVDRTVLKFLRLSTQFIISFAYHLNIFPGWAFPVRVSQQCGGVVGYGKINFFKLMKSAPDAAQGGVFVQKCESGNFSQS